MHDGLASAVITAIGRLRRRSDVEVTLARIGRQPGRCDVPPELDALWDRLGAMELSWRFVGDSRPAGGLTLCAPSSSGWWSAHRGGGHAVWRTGVAIPGARPGASQLEDGSLWFDGAVRPVSPGLETAAAHQLLIDRLRRGAELGFLLGWDSGEVDADQVQRLADGGPARPTVEATVERVESLDPERARRVRLGLLWEHEFRTVAAALGVKLRYARSTPEQRAEALCAAIGDGSTIDAATAKAAMKAFRGAPATKAGFVAALVTSAPAARVVLRLTRTPGGPPAKSISLGVPYVAGVLVDAPGFRIPGVDSDHVRFLPVGGLAAIPNVEVLEGWVGRPPTCRVAVSLADEGAHGLEVGARWHAAVVDPLQTE